jgi:hypothetical protein
MRRCIFMAVLVVATSAASYGATYKSHDLDGKDFDCTAHSDSTGKDYDATIAFSADEATLTFTNGHHLTLTLDDEDIDDPNSISATDNRGTSWDLDVPDIENEVDPDDDPDPGFSQFASNHNSGVVTEIKCDR